jgi:hypothetical protein
MPNFMASLPYFLFVCCSVLPGQAKSSLCQFRVAEDARCNQSVTLPIAALPNPLRADTILARIDLDQC